MRNIKKETTMVENLRTGDVVTIDKWMNEYEFTPDEYVGKTATVICRSDRTHVRLDIDNGYNPWCIKYLTLKQKKSKDLQVGDRVVIQQPTDVQRRRYPATWVSDMDEFIGEIMTIAGIYNGGGVIQVQETDWRFSECNLVHVQDDFCLY